MNNNKINQIKTKTITIFSMKLVVYLIFKGFILVGMDRHKTDSSKFVYFFRNTDNLKKAINNYNDSDLKDKDILIEC